MYTLTSKQSDLYYTLDDVNNKRILVDGGARSGKTITIMLWILSQMQKYAGIRILALRKHRNHIKTTLLDGTIKDLLRNRTDFKINEVEMTVTHSNGSTLRLDGVDDKERVDKILGSEYAIIFINEASQVEYQALKIIISRLAQNVEGLEKRTLVLDTNPKSTLHWIYQLCVNNVHPDTHQPSKDVWIRRSFIPQDNPFLPKDTIESLQNLSGTERKRLYEGVWASAEGLVFPNFSTNHIIHKDVTNAQAYIVGVDCGMNDPNVLSLFAVIDNSIHLNELYYKPGKDMSMSISDAMQKWQHLKPSIAVDPSASPAIIELRSKGYSAFAANNKVREGIISVNDLINTNRLTVEPSVSQLLVEEIQQYELDQNTDLPNNSTPHHILDSLRYATMAYMDSIGKLGKIFV